MPLIGFCVYLSLRCFVTLVRLLSSSFVHSHVHTYRCALPFHFFFLALFPFRFTFASFFCMHASNNNNSNNNTSTTSYRSVSLWVKCVLVCRISLICVHEICYPIHTRKSLCGCDKIRATITPSNARFFESKKRKMKIFLVPISNEKRIRPKISEKITWICIKWMNFSEKPNALRIEIIILGNESTKLTAKMLDACSKYFRVDAK